MDGVGRATDNAICERLWRSLKTEEVYLHDYRDVLDAEEGIGRYFSFYNERRPHQSLAYKTPSSVYQLFKDAQCLMPLASRANMR